MTREMNTLLSTPMLTRLLSLLLVLPAMTASAHEHWIETEVSGKQLKVYLRVGEHFESSEPVLVRRRDRYTRFEVLSPAGVVNAQPQLREDASPLLLLEAPQACAVAVEAAPIDIELDAQKFEAYLFEERLYDVLVARASAGAEESPGRERYSRSLRSEARSRSNCCLQASRSGSTRCWWRTGIAHGSSRSGCARTPMGR